MKYYNEYFTLHIFYIFAQYIHSAQFRIFKFHINA